MLRRLTPLLMVLACFVLDTTVLPVVYGGVYTVSLTLVAVLLIGMLLGRMSGLLYGTIGGLLIDITCGTLGILTFLYMGIGFMVGLILYNPGERLRTARRHTRRRRLQRAGWVCALYIVSELVLLIMQYFNTAELRPVYFVNIAVRTLLCTGITMLLLPAASSMLVGNRSRIPTRDREVKSF